MTLFHGKRMETAIVIVCMVDRQILLLRYFFDVYPTTFCLYTQRGQLPHPRHFISSPFNLNLSVHLPDKVS